MVPCLSTKLLGQYSSNDPFVLGWAVCVGVLIVLFVLTIPFIAWITKAIAIRCSFKALAEQYMGSYNGMVRFPEVAFRNKRVLFQVKSTGSVRNQRNQVLIVSANWPDRHFRLRLAPESPGTKLQSFMGVRDIAIGYKQFDKAFVIQSNDENRLLRLLTAHVRKSLFQLLRSGDKHEFDLQIVGGSITWRRNADLASELTLQSQVEQFLKTYHVMVAALQSAEIVESLSEDEIKFLSPSVVTRIDSTVELAVVDQEQRIPICLFCGTVIVERRVDCKSCNTAHHRECWEEVGMCTIYGCGQKKYRKSKKKQGEKSETPTNLK